MLNAITNSEEDICMIFITDDTLSIKHNYKQEKNQNILICTVTLPTHNFC